MKYILTFLSVLLIFVSCTKVSSKYECTKNCKSLTIVGKITNITDSTFYGVSNRQFDFKLVGRNKVYYVGSAYTNSTGEYSFTTLIDTSILGIRECQFEISTKMFYSDSFYAYSNNSQKFDTYPPNGTDTFNLFIQEFIDMEITYKRSLTDSFEHAEIFHSWTPKSISGDYSQIQYSNNILPRNIKLKYFANRSFYAGVFKHSGVWDTIPSSQGLGTYEINNTTISDTFFVSKNSINKFILNY